MKYSVLAMATAAYFVTGGVALAQTQGVTKDEVVIGSLADLSGPLSGPGKQIRNGMLLRMEEVNEGGGIHGRKLVIKFEDTAYDPRKAVLGAQKLVNSDKVFAIAGSPGTVVNTAAFPVMFPKNVISFMPITGAREMYEPANKLKFAFLSTYYDQVKLSLPDFVKEKNLKRVCALVQDDDLGLEVRRGATDGLATIGMKLEETTTYKRGATEFTTQMQRLASSKCDTVVLGAIIRETIGAMAAASRLSFNPVFFGSTASYSELIPKLGGNAVNGLYATMTVEVPYLDAPSAPVKAWAEKYKTRFNEDPGLYSVYGYQLLDIFVEGAKKAGADLTTDSFIAAMESFKREPDMFGSPVMTWSSEMRLGNAKARLSQIQDGRWKVVSDYK